MNNQSPKVVILSTPMVITEGLYEMKEIDLFVAKKIIEKHKVENYVGHETVKILGLTPSKERKECEDYDIAIIIKPKKRLEFGKEYSIEEIEKIGYNIYKVQKISERGMEKNWE